MRRGVVAAWICLALLVSCGSGSESESTTPDGGGSGGGSITGGSSTGGAAGSSGVGTAGASTGGSPSGGVAGLPDSGSGGDGGDLCPGATPCSGVCVDTGTDPANCGGCGTKCQSDEVCVAGKCGCSHNATSCQLGTGQRVCVDTRFDPGFCLDCATSCSAAQHCDWFGGCTSELQAFVCAGNATTLLFDPGNCGKCGNKCPASASMCVGGSCTRAIMLVTLNEPHAGNLGGISGADTLCQTQAAAAGLGDTTWRALLSSSTQSAKGLFTGADASLPVVNRAGRVRFSTWSAMFAGNPKKWITWFFPSDSTGLLVFDNTKSASTPGWHGTNLDGTVAPGSSADVTCSDWTSEQSTNGGMAGAWDASELLSQTARPCNQPAAVGCVSIRADNKSNGTACASSQDCASSFCADGVCCDNGCTGACRACNLSGSVGKCKSHAAGSDPEGSCGAYTCDGSGACATSCSGTCSSACGSYCSGGLCASSKKADGQTCTVACECASAACVDGYCCDSSCTGKCKACNKAGNLGKCTNHTAYSDPEGDCGNYQCAGNGTCYSSCVTGATADCPSSFCKSGAFCAPGGSCASDLNAGQACLLSCQCKSGTCLAFVCL